MRRFVPLLSAGTVLVVAAFRDSVAPSPILDWGPLQALLMRQPAIIGSSNEGGTSSDS